MMPATRTSKAGPRPRELPIPTPATTASRNRRQPALFALAVAFLALCGVGGWAAFSSASATVPVIGVRNTITRGEVIQRGDLVTVQVGHDPALHTIPVDQADNVIGRRAATDLPAGSVVPVGSVTDALVPAKLHSIVGIFAKDGTGTRIDVDVDVEDAIGLQILAAQGRIALVIVSQEH